MELFIKPKGNILMELQLKTKYNIFLIALLFVLTTCSASIMVTDYYISENSNFAKKEIKYLNWEKDFGIKIIKIKRNGQFLKVISDRIQIQQNDTLTIIGSNSEINRFKMIYK